MLTREQEILNDPWRNIDTELPEILDGYSDQVLLRLEGDRYVISYLDNSITWSPENRRWSGLNRLEQRLVTHWCPIPKFNK